MTKETRLFLINFIPLHSIRHRLRHKIKATERNYTIGEHSYTGAEFIAPGTIIGKYCSIAAGVKIGADYHPINYISTSPNLFKESYTNGKLSRFPHIEIGHDVWIGYNVLIIKSCKIGTGAVIGAGSVVTHDIPPYAIAYGVPARVVGYRFDKPTINKLLKSKWWDLAYNKLLELDFSVEPKVFLKNLENKKQ